MSTIMALVGESGSGKSTSLRNLDPKTTYIISVINKQLPFKGSNKIFNKEAKNYFSTTDFNTMKKLIENVNTQPTIKTLVIDDFQYMMTDDFVSRAKEKGYDKWTDMAQNVYETIESSKRLRDDLLVVFIFHEEQDGDKKRIKTLGKMLNEKVTVEGLFSIVIFSEARESEYVFITQGRGITTAKSPMDMFESVEIPNDMKLVVDAINKYYE